MNPSSSEQGSGLPLTGGLLSRLPRLCSGQFHSSNCVDQSRAVVELPLSVPRAIVSASSLLTPPLRSSWGCGPDWCNDIPPGSCSASWTPYNLFSGQKSHDLSKTLVASCHRLLSKSSSVFPSHPEQNLNSSPCLFSGLCQTLPLSPLPSSLRCRPWPLYIPLPLLTLSLHSFPSLFTYRPFWKGFPRPSHSQVILIPSPCCISYAYQNDSILYNHSVFTIFQQESKFSEGKDSVG